MFQGQVAPRMVKFHDNLLVLTEALASLSTCYYKSSRPSSLPQFVESEVKSCPKLYSSLHFVRILVLVPLFISLLTDSEKRGAALSLEETTNGVNELKQ